MAPLTSRELQKMRERAAKELGFDIHRDQSAKPVTWLQKMGDRLHGTADADYNTTKGERVGSTVYREEYTAAEELQPEWMPDDCSPVCASCEVKFSMMLRRHHCRCCGMLLCSTCSPYKETIPYLGYPDTPHAGATSVVCDDILHMSMARLHG
ncbi:hypothetical protein CYMTET_21074 [Cymbomonas tetramitiformis]|uniref:FYVE-type domain-containing protein n=1 Tax=Cymbomonas tetramitiformis TaxID=36881 RepID=A0AAE0G2R1_9CHLO|nr:hypothetical protein CYMTET_21074 [Cymbomonas tetramitiformis]